MKRAYTKIIRHHPFHTAAGSWIVTNVHNQCQSDLPNLLNQAILMGCIPGSTISVSTGSRLSS